MTSFSLVDKYTEKTEFLPRSVVKNSLIVANSLLISQGVNLNKAKDSVPIVTGKTTNKSSGDYNVVVYKEYHYKVLKTSLLVFILFYSFSIVTSLYKNSKKYSPTNHP
jgi:hypothetical protein